MAKIGIIMGSKSDYPVMKEATEILDDFEISYEIEIVSAYRSYERQKFIWNRKFYSNAEKGISPRENINKIIEYINC